MAIITEEPDSPSQTAHKPKPKPKPKPRPKSPPAQPPPAPAAKPSSGTTTTAVPFHFWFYFTIIVFLITLLFVLLPSFSPQDAKTWFLNLPPVLRHHYTNGRTIKVQTAPNHPQVEVFTVQEGPFTSDNNVLFVHGLGCSSFAFRRVVKSLGLKDVHAVAIDLPGSGFSDKTMIVVEENVGGNGFLDRVWEIYSLIKEKGVFWGFDQLVEQGYVDFEEMEKRVSRKESVKAVELGSEGMGRVLGQVVDSLKWGHVDLVLHDSALGLSANWVAENRHLVRSVMVLDAEPSGTILPLWALEIPLVREVVLGFRFVFEKVLEKCCVDKGVEAEAHRILLSGRDGRKSVVGTGKRLNSSFDLGEWRSLDSVKGLPMRVVWSGEWSEEWSSKGEEVAGAVPEAMFVTHSGGPWPQEHNAEELAEIVYDFVSSLPKPYKNVAEEEPPEHIQKVNDEAKSSDDDHHRHHGHGVHDHHDGHNHGHGHAHAGYMDAYGLGHGWAM